jgi:hypothetical protein
MSDDFHDFVEQMMLVFGPLIGLTLGTVFGGAVVGFAWWFFTSRVSNLRHFNARQAPSKARTEIVLIGDR